MMQKKRKGDSKYLMEFSDTTEDMVKGLGPWM